MLQQIAAARLTSEVLADPCGTLPELDHDEHFRVVMSACIRGILDAVPPERRVPEIIAALGAGTAEQWRENGQCG